MAGVGIAMKIDPSVIKKAEEGSKKALLSTMFKFRNSVNTKLQGDDYVPYDTGNLQQDITVGLPSRSTMSFKIACDPVDPKNGARYAMWVHNGHRIVTRRGVVVGYVQPNPFVTDALDATVKEFQRASKRRR